MALCSTPCWLAGLSAELLACSPAPTVAVPRHGCPVWLGAWESAGAAVRIVTAARTIETLFIVNSICTLFINSLSEIALRAEGYVIETLEQHDEYGFALPRLASESAPAQMTRASYDCSVSASVPASMAVPAAAKQQNENDNDENRGHIHIQLLARSEFRGPH
jgi:hypothetical protein